MSSKKAIVTTNLPDLPAPRRGKVRDVYDLGEKLLIVATDRISAFDAILSPGIPGKGILLTQLSNFWFAMLAEPTGVKHHLLQTNAAKFGGELEKHRKTLQGRSVLARKCQVIPFECVARGYLAGSGWKDYKSSHGVCGVSLPAGLEEAEKLAEPIFTPATKAQEGHDENVNFDTMATALGEDLAGRLKDITIRLYLRAAAYAEERGILIADTKFEFGLDEDGGIVWVDEALTPDSSRFWAKDRYEPGGSPASYDKQFVRDWLEEAGWDKQPPAPELPEEIVEGTLDRYREAFEILTGTKAPV